MRKYAFWLIILAVALATVGVTMLLNQTSEISYAVAEQAQMTATVADARGVDVQSAFALVFPEGVSAASVRRYLDVEPALEIGVHQGGSNQEVLVAPAAPLKADTIYHFTLTAQGQPLHWAFQTQAPLAVIDCAPVDRTTEVGLWQPVSVTFNQQLERDQTNYFQLEPAVAGHYTVNGRTVTFQPSAGWQPDTVYTVEIPAENGLTADFCCQFATVSTANQELNWYLQPGPAVFPQGDGPVFPVETWENTVTGEVDVALYSFGDSESYAQAITDDWQAYPTWSRQANNASQADHSTLRQQGEYTLELLPQADGSLAFALPPDLPAGYYLLRTSYQGIERQRLFQVAKIRGFAVTAAEHTLFWLHDLGGNPLTGVKISDETGQEVSSDASGVAVISHPKGEAAADRVLYGLYCQDQQVIWPVDSRQTATAPQYGLETDRQVYQGGDNLQFWGYGPSLEGSLTVRLLTAAGELAAQTTVTSAGNTYQGVLSLSAAVPGEYLLEVGTPDQLWGRAEITLVAALAAGQVEISGPQENLYRGEEAHFTVTVRDEQGMPWSNLALTYELPGVANGELTTNQEGVVELSLPLDWPLERWLYQEDLCIEAQLPDGSVLQARQPVQASAGTLLPHIQVAQTAEGFTAQVSVYRMTEQETAVGPVAADVPLQARLYRQERQLEWEEGETERGQWQTSWRLLDRQKAVSDEQGQAHFAYEVEADAVAENAVYRWEITAEDESGREIVVEAAGDGHGWQTAAGPCRLAGEKSGTVLTYDQAPQQVQTLFYAPQQEEWQWHTGTILPAAEQADAVWQGVAFNGRTYQAADNAWCGQQESLRLIWQPVEETLTPGSQASAKLYVKDRQGYGQAGVQVLVSVNAAGQSAASAAPLYFGQVVTDEQGWAQVTWTVPATGGDWRLNAWAVDAQLRTASGQTVLASDATLHAVLQAGSFYTAGDQPTLFLGARGGQEEEEQVTYWLRLEGPEQVWEQQLTGDLNRWTAYPLEEELAPGAYQLLVEASAGQEMDGLVHTFQVTAATSPQAVSATMTLEPRQTWQPSADQVAMANGMLILSAPAKGQVLADLWQVSGEKRPSLESRLAATVARQLLVEYGGEDLSPYPGYQEPDFQLYQTDSGGLAHLPGAPAELRLSAQAAALGSESLANPELAAYFRQQYGSSHDSLSQAWALVGLAALQEKVLPDIRALLAQPELPTEAELALIWGLVVAGDQQGAASVFRSRQEAWFAQDQPTAALTGHEVGALVVTAYCGTPAQYFSLRQLVMAQEDGEEIGMEQVLACRGILPRLRNPEASISYTLAGEKDKVQLTAGQDVLLSWGQIMAAAAGAEEPAITLVNGSSPVGITLLAVGEEAGEEVETAGVELSRSYDVLPGSGAGWGRVTLTYRLPAALPAGWYWVEDRLPTAFSRPLNGAGQEEKVLMGSQNRQISYVFYKEEATPLTGACHYVAPLNSQGQYVVAPARLTELSSGKQVGGVSSQRVSLP